MSLVTFKIRIYIDDGRVFIYEVRGESSAREHANAIALNGYRHDTETGLEVYPVWRILKVKIIGPVTTNYIDTTEGT